MTIPDLPDNYPWLPGSERFPLGDLGEHAVRLGSPMRFDRRGEVLWYDQFEHGLAPYKISSIGDGASVKISTDETFMSAYAALLTAGSTTGRMAELGKSLQPASLGKWGAEVAIAFLDTADYFEFHLTISDGDIQHQPAFRISQTDNELQYKNAAQTYTGFATLGSMLTSPETYRLAKLVFDLSTDKYVYFRFGPDEHDLSDIPFFTKVSAAAPQFFIRARLIGNLGDNDKVQIGHIIFTANEP